jgi:hypothetical protein
MRISQKAGMSDKINTMSGRRESGIGYLTAKGRIYMGIFGLAVLTPGLVVLLLGGSSYVDYRGLVAFARAMILIGFLLVVIAVVRGRPAHRK